MTSPDSEEPVHGGSLTTAYSPESDKSNGAASDDLETLRSMLSGIREAAAGIEDPESDDLREQAESVIDGSDVIESGNRQAVEAGILQSVCRSNKTKALAVERRADSALEALERLESEVSAE